MKTMRRTATTTLVILGGLIGMAAGVLAALTNTGLSGAYAFGALGLLIVGTLLMWPERTRFPAGRSSTPARADERRDQGNGPPHHPRML
jgi:hypothetical protein